jgi:hypothetical protein
MDTAYAIFEHDNSHWLAWTLQPGYRHVWCLIPDRDADAWVGVNFGRRGIEVYVYARLDYDVEGYARSLGHEVVPVSYDPTSWHRLPVIMNSCVGLSKAVLGDQFPGPHADRAARHTDTEDGS